MIDTTEKPQHILAWEKANRIRVARAQDKLQITKGTLSPADVLREMPEHWLSATVAGLLMPMRRVGRTKVNERFASRAGCSSDRRLRDLTDRQRLVLGREVDVYLGARR
jgi:hypothetical protein